MLHLTSKSAYQATLKRHSSGAEETVYVVEKRRATESSAVYDNVLEMCSQSAEKEGRMRDYVPYLVRGDRKVRIDLLREVSNGGIEE